MSASARRFRRRHTSDQPDMIDLPRFLWPAGVSDGVYVHHQTGCVFGDRVAKINALGVVPAMYTTPNVRRCDR